MYLYDKNRITYFAETDRRNKRVPFGIKAEDRTRHMYIIGKTGMGKSTLIENMVAQDIKNGEGFAFIDPHGKSAAMLLDYIPADRVKDVVYFAPFDTDTPVSFNVMEDVGPDKRHLVANGLLSAFKKIWGPETFSARMEYIMMNALLALLEYPESTLLGVSRMLTDKAYRKKVVDNVKDPSVKAYWVDEFAKYSENYAKDAVPGIQNKLGQFTSNPLIRNIIGQPRSSFDLRKMMDERKILIVNLSKGQLGEGNANLLGGMIITKIYLAAMSRADLTEAELKPLPNFYMYVDEFQSFANESFADILSEARKYKLALVVAHQYIKQMDEKVADAVFGNVGTQIMFRVGAPDAEVLEKEYAPVFTAEDMVSLGFTQIYLKLMIDGVASHPFSAVTLGPIAPPPKSLREEVIQSSRTLYGHPRAVVEKNIADWFASGSEVSPAPVRERVVPQASSPAPSTQFPPRPSTTPQATREPWVKKENNESFKPRPAPSFPPRNPVQQNTEKRTAPQFSAPKKYEKPFAQAFQDIQKPPQKPEPQPQTPPQPQTETPHASLATLSQPKRPIGIVAPIKSKSPTPANMSDLKNALADVLKKEEKKPEQAFSPAPQSEQKKEQAPPPPPQKPPQNFNSQNQSTPPREVPEDVLTAILMGDD
ncbi:MAG: type IV secretion system DNA-binding domain-containing protein [bacterium]|nr:type IV secretion system DNA-binding domain-containing protein [bacterium]